MVKEILIVLSLAQGSISFAQQGGNVLSFDYDEAGNQIVRELICLGIDCLPIMGVSHNGVTGSSFDKEVEENWSLSRDVAQLKYYPNPVKEDLFVNWEEISNDRVLELWIYNATGQLLEKHFTVVGESIAMINFSDYPVGMYQVILFFQNQEEQILRIIKK